MVGKVVVEAHNTTHIWWQFKWSVGDDCGWNAFDDFMREDVFLAQLFGWN